MQRFANQITGFYIKRAFTENNFRTACSDNFLLNVVVIVNFKRIEIIRKEVSVLTLKKYLSLKCWRSYMKSKIYLLENKIEKMTKKLK